MRNDDRSPHQPDEPPPVDPDLYRRDDMRAALAHHDFGIIYLTLKDEVGLSQRRIAGLTGQAQSEVSEILSGRRVLTYAVLTRIVDGLGIPAALAGLSWYGPDGANAYPDSVPVAESPKGAEVEMLRRHLMALGAIATFGTPITGLGELATDPRAPTLPVELPERIGAVDVDVIRGYTDHLRALSRTHGGQARPAVALTQWADRWLDADATDATRRLLQGALSDLHTITAWACHDIGAVARSHYHFARALELANDAGDGYRAAYAMRHAAMMLVERSEPNNGLKLTQLAGLRLDAMAPGDARVPVLLAWCHVVGALALARLDEPTDSICDQSRSQLTQARDGWEPPSGHSRGDMDLITGLTYLNLGRLDAAESALAASAQTFARGADRREGAVADTALALVHVRAEDSRGLAMAQDAITAVSATKSANARQLWLVPLADALEARPGADARELARTARQLAAGPV